MLKQGKSITKASSEKDNTAVPQNETTQADRKSYTLLELPSVFRRTYLQPVYTYFSQQENGNSLKI